MSHLPFRRAALVLAALSVGPAIAGTPPSFVFTSTTSTAGDTPSDIAVLDVDGDGHLDVVSAASGQAGGDSELTVKLGDGTGHFPGEETSKTSYLEGFDLADFDEDGTLDVVTCGGSYFGGTLRIQFLKGQGNGKFTPGAIQPLTGKPADVMHDVAAGDFDGDGHLDVFVVGDFSANLWLGAGDGTFTPAPSFPYAYAQRTAGAFDFDADGHLDAVAGGKVYRGNGDGTFVTTPVGPGGRWGALGDVDLDGRVDVVGVSTSGVGIGLNRGDGTFDNVSGVAFGPGTELTWGALGDFDRDAFPDVVVADKGTHTLWVLSGLGAGHFGPPASGLNVADHLRPVGTGDFDGDGREDIVALSGFADQAPVLWLFANTTTPSDWTGRAGHSGLVFYGAPSLGGCGAITGGAPLTLELSHTSGGGAPWFLAIGAAEVALPLFEGILIPSPDLVLALATDVAGNASVPLSWPTALPSGSQLFFQAWVVQSLSPLTVTSSNGLVGTQE
jgi:hypothetical protein